MGCVFFFFFFYFQDLFDVDHFEDLFWICSNIASVLCFGFWLQGMWELSFLSRVQTSALFIGRQKSQPLDCQGGSYAR